MRISDWSSDVCSSDLLDLFRRGAGGDVEVLGMAADHQVAHGAADQESLVAALAQAVEHAQRIGTDVLARNRMLVPRDDAPGRTEERRGGKECVSTCRYWCSPYH